MCNTTNFKTLNAVVRSRDNESIEEISDPEKLKDEVFLGYFATNDDGIERPVSAPRRIIGRPVDERKTTDLQPDRGAVVIAQDNSGVRPAFSLMDQNITLGSLVGIPPRRRRRARSIVEVGEAVQNPNDEADTVSLKSGKESAIAEVRGFRISLSTDSQGRYLSLIPPGSDGLSTPNMFSMTNDSDRKKAPPQSQAAEGDWYKAGPEFQQGQTRFRMYGNPFDAGVVLPHYTGPRPPYAVRHNTTNLNTNPDPREIVSDLIPLCTVAQATVYPRGSAESEYDSTTTFPSKKSVGFSQPQKSHNPTGSAEIWERLRSGQTVTSDKNSPAKNRRFVGSHMLVSI